MPPQLACCQGRKGPVEIRCDAKDGARYVPLAHIVGGDDLLQ